MKQAYLPEHIRTAVLFLYSTHSVNGRHTTIDSMCTTAAAPSIVGGRPLRVSYSLVYPRTTKQTVAANHWQTSVNNTPDHGTSTY